MSSVRALFAALSACRTRDELELIRLVAKGIAKDWKMEPNEASRKLARILRGVQQARSLSEVYYWRTEWKQVIGKVKFIRRRT